MGKTKWSDVRSREDSHHTLHAVQETRRFFFISFTIKGETVEPKDQVKIVGVVMDARLRFKQHIARAATKKAAEQPEHEEGSRACCRRQQDSYLRLQSPPVVDYASSVWTRTCGAILGKGIELAQRVGAQAIVGCFRTF